MNLAHRIEIIEPKKLIGFRIITSFKDDKTSIVWRKFMSRRAEITNRSSDLSFSLQIYPENFTPSQFFEKWALAEVSDFEYLPQGFETFDLERGKYLVFDYQGSAEKGPELFRYIFKRFIPYHNFKLDHRPHFESFRDNYDSKTDSEKEKIWIPLK